MLLRMVFVFFAAAAVSTEGMSGTLTGECYAPSGKRISFDDNAFENTDDRYTNANPTFLFNEAEPDILIERWPAASPFPDIMSREEVDEITPPTTIRSAVIRRADAVISAVFVARGEYYTTTLYLNKAIGLFTRTRDDITKPQEQLGAVPFVSVYSARCSFWRSD